MAAEPINIFSHKRDLAGIANVLRQAATNVEVTGPDHAWERITISGQKSWFRKAPCLVFKNVPDYYEGPGWPTQVAGMQGYFMRFPEVPRKADILQRIGTFRFALATEFEPDLFLESNDPRLGFLFKVVRHLDGVLFTPSGLWDASGRALICADGRADAAAVLPGLPARDTVPAAKGAEGSAQTESNPPDARRVVRRALGLAAVAGRGLLEVEGMPPAEKQAVHQRLLAWANELALEDELEKAELELLRGPMGSLPQQATVDATWKLEGLAVLLWALGRFEVPPYDKLIDTGALLPAAGFLNLNQATAVLASPALRPPEELRKFQKQCFALHWRLRDFSLRPQAMNFRAFAGTAWFGPLDVSLARFHGDDLAIGDAAIVDAAQDEFRTALSIANERHRAINWLVEGGRVYSETDTST